MLVQNWVDVVVSSLQSLWTQVISWLPSLIGALIVFVIGLLVAGGLKSLAEKIINAVKLDSLLRKAGLEEFTRRAGINLNSGRFLGWLVYWFIVIAFLLAASDILGFFALSTFLRDVLLYLPNIITAILIMVVALVASTVVGKAVRVSVMGAKLHMAKFLGSAAQWVIVIFGILAALSQLGIAAFIVNTLVTGAIAMLALAGGLAFGLGGRDYAAHLMEEFRNEIEGKK